MLYPLLKIFMSSKGNKVIRTLYKVWISKMLPFEVRDILFECLLSQIKIMCPRNCSWKLNIYSTSKMKLWTSVPRGGWYICMSSSPSFFIISESGGMEIALLMVLTCLPSPTNDYDCWIPDLVIFLAKMFLFPDYYFKLYMTWKCSSPINLWGLHRTRSGSMTPFMYWGT